MQEGAGEGGGAAPGLWAALKAQWAGIASGWGLPAIVLAWVGRPRQLVDTLDRDLAALWSMGLVLFVLALFSPLEARYVYALTLPASVAAGHGLVRLWDGGVSGRVAAVGLFALQAALAIRDIVEAVFFRYRP